MQVNPDGLQGFYKVIAYGVGRDIQLPADRIIVQAFLAAEQIDGFLLRGQLIDSLLYQGGPITQEQGLFCVVVGKRPYSREFFQHPALVELTFDLIEGMTGGDGEDISFGVGHFIQFLPVLPDLYKYFLGELFGKCLCPDHLKHEGIDTAVPPAEQLFESPFVSPGDPVKQVGICIGCR